MALILTLFIVPLAIQANGLGSQRPQFACDAALSAESPIGAILERAILESMNSLQNGQIEQNAKLYFREPIIPFRVEKKRRDLIALADEKIELLEKALALHRLKMANGQVDRLWIVKLSLSLSWLSDLIVDKPARQQADGSYAYFHLWRDIPKVIRMTKAMHILAITELQMETPVSRQVRELIESNLDFGYEPRIRSLSQEDILLGILNKVHYLELTSFVSEADLRLMSPSLFTEHDRLHAMLFSRHVDFSDQNLKAFDRFRIAFLKSFPTYNFKSEQHRRDLISLLFYVSHENPALLMEFIMQIESSKLEIPQNILRAYNSYLKNRGLELMSPDMANEVYSELLSLLNIGGY